MDTFLATINDNKQIVLKNHDYASIYLEKYIGLDLEVELRLEPKTRTDKQNRWYWGVAVNTIIQGFFQQTGILHTKAEIHFYVLKYIIEAKLDMKIIMGQQVITYDVKTTSQMSTVEFMHFKDILQKHFAEKGIDIPDPNEDLWKKKSKN